jgi:sugar phosphate isomerase/epimerase
VKVAIEMHPGFVVYSPETMLRLREVAGPTIGCNYDPSHMFWQGIDPIGAIRVLGEAIFHVHAKDTQMYSANLVRTGVLDTKPYTDERNRGWIFRTCGYGHGAEWWREFASTLRMFGYDGVLSIEHEDSLLSAEEGLTKAVRFLNGVVMLEKPGSAWWV